MPILTAVVEQVREKLGADAVLMQINIGNEDKFEGVVDLVAMKAYYFDGSNGENVRTEEIPEDLKAEAEEYRAKMLESLSMYSDELMEKLLGEEEVSEELIHDITRHAVIEQEFCPVFLRLGVQEQGRAAADERHHALSAGSDRSRKHRHRPEHQREDGARFRPHASRWSRWASRSPTTSMAS